MPNYSTILGGASAYSAASTALDGRVTTAEGDITALDGRLSTAETDIGALEDDLLQWTSARAAAGLFDAPGSQCIRSGVAYTLSADRVIYVGDVLHVSGRGQVVVQTDRVYAAYLANFDRVDYYQNGAWANSADNTGSAVAAIPGDPTDDPDADDGSAGASWVADARSMRYAVPEIISTAARDETARLQQALRRASDHYIKAGIRGSVRLPAGAFRLTSNLTVEGVSLFGEGKARTVLLPDPGVTAIEWSAKNELARQLTKTTYEWQTTQLGTSFADFTVAGTNGDAQEGMRLRESADHAMWRDIDFFNLDLAYILGDENDVNNSFIRESQFARVKTVNCGTTSSAAVTIGQGGFTGDTDGTNILSFHQCGILYSLGVGLHIVNANAVEYLRRTQFTSLMLHGRGSDSAVAVPMAIIEGNVSRIQFDGLQFNSSEPTQPMIVVREHAASGLTPTDVRIQGDISTAQGGGVWVEKCNGFEIDLSSSSTGLDTVRVESGAIASGATSTLNLRGPFIGGAAPVAFVHEDQRRLVNGFYNERLHLYGEERLAQRNVANAAASALSQLETAYPAANETTRSRVRISTTLDLGDVWARVVDRAGTLTWEIEPTEGGRVLLVFALDADRSAYTDAHAATLATSIDTNTWYTHDGTNWVASTKTAVMSQAAIAAGDAPDSTALPHLATTGRDVLYFDSLGASTT